MSAHLPGSDVDRSDIDEATRRALERDLRHVVRGEVLFDGATRAIYATDSSNYRQVPLGVVYPLDDLDVRRAVEVVARHGAPILARGAGTSLAGQACNVAVVLDVSRHMNRIIEIDAQRRIARVQPGVVDKVSWVGTATPLRDRSDRRGDLPVVPVCQMDLAPRRPRSRRRVRHSDPRG